MTVRGFQAHTPTMAQRVHGLTTISARAYVLNRKGLMCYARAGFPAPTTDSENTNKSVCVIYNAHTIDDLDDKSVRNLSPSQLTYIKSIVKNGITRYIDNIKPDVAYGLIVYDGWALPFTVNHREAEAFPVSPKTCYFMYPLLIESRDYARKRAPVTRLIIKMLARFVRFERLVVLNNWFITNNPTPQFSREALREFKHALIKRYPRHLLIIKSIPETDPTNVSPSLRDEGFDLIRWRYCHYWRPNGPLSSKRTKQFKVDQKLLAKTALETSYATSLSEQESKDCETLYRKLYIEKYTNMNVRLTHRWFALTCNSGFIDYFMTRDKGDIKAFALSYKDPIGINAGYLGYDLESGRNLGLYRIIFAAKLKKGADENRPVNLSSGVARFKKLRGARLFAELEGVHSAHLSFFTCTFIRLFIAAHNRFGSAIRPS